MTTFRWFDGNLGFYGFPFMGNYSVVSHSATQMGFRAINSTDGVYEPFRFVFTIAGGAVWTDPDGQGTSYTAGTITGVNYFNQAGTKVAEVTGLAADAAFAFALLGLPNSSDVSEQSFWNYVQTLNPEGALFVGSDATGRADLEGYVFETFDRGDDIGTTTGNDTVQAGGDSDYMTDRGGADLYDGGAGEADLVSYHAWRNMPLVPQTGIVADLAQGRVTGPDGLVDQLIGIEAVRGTHHADVIRGSAADNFLLGGAGADTLDGRGGFDEVFYRWDGGRGIRVDMAAGTVRDGHGAVDRLVSIESVVGTYRADRFVDKAGSQSFRGEDGDDVFSLSGGADTVTGGTGQDTFRFVGTAFGKDRITDFHRFEGDRIHLTGAEDFSDLAFSNANGNRIITLGSAQIVLEGHAGLVMDAGDFIFG
jgi:Ca2+-binding RTX toxin-like protein